MYVTSLLNTCIIHVNIAQHVYTQMLEFTVFKHNFPMLKQQIMVKYCIKLFQNHLNIFITRIIKF